MHQEYRISRRFASFILRSAGGRVYNTVMDVSITGKDISIDWKWVREELVRKERVGSFDKKASTQAILACIDECLRTAQVLASPRIHSVRKRVVSIGRGVIKLEKGITFSGKWLASFLKGSQAVRIFVVTVGDSIEHAATSLMHKGEHLHGYMLDRIGSMAVESAAQSAEDLFRKRYEAKAKSVSMRVSPGYCDWPIEDQETLARAIDLSRAGVSLTKACMMVPKKSISAMVGIGPTGLFAKAQSPCSICPTKSCSYRRE